MSTSFMAYPSPHLKLHASTQKPQQKRPKTGPHRSKGGSAATPSVEVDKRLPTWIKTPKLCPLAA
jgi:hypothetical protein